VRSEARIVSRFRWLWIVSLPILIFDQITKIYIDTRFALYESVVLIENFLAITYVRNKGAAFGILSDSAIRIPFFIGVSVAAIVAILWYLARLREDQERLRFSLALILGGAVGNLVDRIRLGEVIDFVDVHWYQYHWPAFNVADAAITIGVALLLIDMWLEERRKS
jgi:signal peptidase II